MKHADNKRKAVKEAGLSKSTLYYKSKQEAKDEATKIRIGEALRKHPSYGHKRLAIHLKINEKRILRVMKKYDLRPYRRRGKKPPSKATGVADYSNLLLTNTLEFPNHIWASDFTYLWFEDKWLYVATVIDIFTRKIVGLSV